MRTGPGRMDYIKQKEWDGQGIEKKLYQKNIMRILKMI